MCYFKSCYKHYNMRFWCITMSWGKLVKDNNLSLYLNAKNYLKRSFMINLLG